MHNHSKTADLLLLYRNNIFKCSKSVSKAFDVAIKYIKFTCYTTMLLCRLSTLSRPQPSPLPSKVTLTFGNPCLCLSLTFESLPCCIQFLTGNNSSQAGTVTLALDLNRILQNCSILYSDQVWGQSNQSDSLSDNFFWKLTDAQGVWVGLRWLCFTSE